ncbi:MAG: 3D-(3,5/4)-trihydroxycyclohexane-1,2-dione acylhydrolase (decyclizing) [Bacteroidetes bacterium]|nr:3D-(3,5/4)-trihydroxycyclohexane-1,2-dione acylhydrolase (decyclizing) [Bacteroidota bacterium]MBU1116945.1 3D-(3,5/4)-trihydroxycyclohexane-1,2-dione acylhydrolase (decyclizing) [Bacteroidota bacterium]MBU1799118.1 3D-(3,5/4)-trihydroxycyclohexane-1,2-dione acylhydrolase (decyclizing) [Bacteroidota bacterium]
MSTVKLTVAQAVIKFLMNQYVERDGNQNKFFAGCFGIFGHGNVAGIGQALNENPEFRYYQTRNEQSMVHIAAAYAKMKNRLSTFVCTTSIGPGATNMITGAAAATINRLPVLLIPGDIFARRNVAPVLQQLESQYTQDISVNDCFKPVSKYWDRINRPEQLITSLPEVMRVLTSPSETGTVTLSIPQDVQAEAFDFPKELFRKRVWNIPRTRPDSKMLLNAVNLINESKKPVIVSGGGTIYSEATKKLCDLIDLTGIPVAETFAGKGSVPYNKPENLGAVGATGTPGAVEMTAEADLIIGVGTRYSDFTTSSKTAFQNPNVKFININVTDFDSHKHSALPLIGDAKETLNELIEKLTNYKVDESWRNKAVEFNRSWDAKVEEYYTDKKNTLISQAELVGVVNQFSDKKDVVLCAAGSLPGDLHKLWRTQNEKGFHLEYGYSTMGYEIAGGIGAKLACPDREIYVLVGDGNYLMNNHEIITAIQEGIKITIVLLNNNGFASIGGLSESLGSQRFGTNYRYRNSSTGKIDGEILPVDFVKNAESLGANVLTATDVESLNDCLVKAKESNKTTLIYIETDLVKGVAGYSWWEVPVSEVSEMESVKDAYSKYVENKKKQKYYL